MKPLNAFVNTQYSQPLIHEYGDRLQGIDSHIFSHMFRALSRHDNQKGKVDFLVSCRDRRLGLRSVKDLAQLGIDMNANDRFHELLKEYGRCG